MEGKNILDLKMLDGVTVVYYQEQPGMIEADKNNIGLIDILRSEVRAYRELEVDTKCYTPSTVSQHPCKLPITHRLFNYNSNYGVVWSTQRDILIEIQAKLFRLEKLEEFYERYKKLNGDT